ncbi:hypothetical protein STEG23_028578 [Scotinomys teguina]
MPLRQDLFIKAQIKYHIPSSRTIFVLDNLAQLYTNINVLCTFKAIKDLCHPVSSLVELPEAPQSYCSLAEVQQMKSSEARVHMLYADLLHHHDSHTGSYQKM